MQIISIHLKNIKSHRDSKISFSPGINVLSGPNGVGKSTVFEAVGYAMFGVDARDFVSNVDRFLTIGEKRGMITVTFTADDGDTYQVSRTVGTPANWRLAKEVGDGFEFEDHAGAEETESRIRELLRLSAGRSLADQFKLVIGPFQNDFLGPFVLKQQTKRKEAFDEILGIDSWRKTFEETKELGSTIKGMIGALEADISGKEERVACLPERRKELENLGAQQESRKKELEECVSVLASVAEQLREMEERKVALESLRNEIAQVEQSILSGNEYIVTQKTSVEQAEAAARAVEEARPGRERYGSAEKMLLELREREKAKQSLEKEIADLANKAASALQAAEHEEKEAADLEKTLKDEVEKLKEQEHEVNRSALELSEREKTLQLAIDRHREMETAFAVLPVHQLHTVTPYLKVTLARLAEIDGQVHEKKALLIAEQEWKAKAEILERLRRERDELHGERARLEGRRTGILEGEEKLGQGLCPFFQEECGNLEGKASLDVFAGKKRHLESQIELQVHAISALDRKIEEAETASREMEKFRLLRNEVENLEQERREREKQRLDHVKLLDQASVADTMAQWLEKYRLEHCRNEGEKLVAAEFSGAPADQLSALERWEQGCHDAAESVRLILGRMLTDVEEPLAALRAEKGRIDALSEEVTRRKRDQAEAEQRIRERRKSAGIHREAANAAVLEKQATESRLAMFADVEESIRSCEEVKMQTLQDHERFLQAEPTALELPRRQETLARYVKRLEELEQEKSAKQGKFSELSTGYSAETHAAAQGRKEALNASTAALREALNHLDQNLKRVAGEVAELQKVQEEIGRKQEELRELRKKEELVKYLRNRVFNKVSAQLSERFREEIGTRADTIYRTIAESDEELHWGENYQIVLRDMVDGTIRERTDDQLSGGQLMSAVVALRLALLQTTGARVAFFDEPTSNLDASRRGNLAQAFRAIDHGKEEVSEHWYDQLFLISHDVSFTEITDQVIQLEGDLGSN
ncbi:AAA family ATPase [Geobacter sp. DSM 9736]|uniref:AAA family ATPase n=1 Tax=Geobacter sp. DSM 9736 TaxID=1277350 RepID=UPI000B4FF618|nr:SMC family ATPase [Geobacter sp. DSM 9736]SNB46279.1 exonuclease SbcC [Geobacter sp. DSM 9736]